MHMGIILVIFVSRSMQWVQNRRGFNGLGLGTIVMLSYPLKLFPPIIVTKFSQLQHKAVKKPLHINIILNMQITVEKFNQTLHNGQINSLSVDII